MEAFGARLEVLPSPEGITPELIPRMRARAAAASLGAYQTDQFRNTDMIEGYRRLGEEAAEQVRNDRRPVPLRRHGEGASSVSVEHCERYPAMARIAVEPGESAVLSGGTPGTHRIEGGGVGFGPSSSPERSTT